MEEINIALLIDCDNISAKYIPTIISELSKYGKITIRRMYGDWSQDRLRSWLSCSAGYSLTPIMQPNNTPGKNASDIGLIIDAMDTLYSNSVDGFCIVSSDGDFNRLAARLREAGKVVIGMGERKTPESFRVSCERFIFLDVISDSGDTDSDEVGSSRSRRSGRGRRTASGAKNGASGAGSTQTASAAASGTGGGNAEGAPAGASSAPGSNGADAAEHGGSAGGTGGAGSRKKGGASGAANAEPQPACPDNTEEEFLPGDGAGEDAEAENSFTSKEEIEAAIIKMITDNAADGRETGLGEVGSRLTKLFPDFDIRNYHYSKLSEFLKDLPSLNVTTRDSGVWISQKITTDSVIERQILSVFRRHDTDDLSISALKQELEEMNPNLDATIRKSGVTRFSVYLNRNIHSVEVNGRHVMLKK